MLRRAWSGRQTAGRAGQPRRTATLLHGDRERRLPHTVPGGAWAAKHL